MRSKNLHKDCKTCKKPLKVYFSTFKRKTFCSRGCASKDKSIRYKGRIVSPETRHKMSISKKGCNNWNYGMSICFSDEHKRNISLSKKGKKLSDSHRESLSKSSRLRWGNLHPLVKRAIRSMEKYCEWRKEVHKRDDYTCQICGKRGGVIHADHIKPFYKIVKENNIQNLIEATRCCELWDINNGRTLCGSCHRKTDTYGRRKTK
jgi:hypothetical protein